MPHVPAPSTLAKYHLSMEDWRRIWDFQGGVCAICTRPFATISTIDHDHRTGLVRGLLCPLCNGTLGKVKDDVAWMRRAIAYLERTPASQCLTKVPAARTITSRRRRRRPTKGGK